MADFNEREKAFEAKFKLDEEETKLIDSSKTPDLKRRPTQDEIFYGDDFDEGDDDLV